MSIMTRYFLRLHVGPFFFSLTVLTSLLFVNVVARRFEELAGKGLPLRVILEVFAFSLPHILALTLPMSVLVSVLYAFSQLTADNEITALKASGVSLRRLLVPLILMGTALGTFMVYFNDRILPETNHYLKTLLIDIARKSPVFTMKEQLINNIQTEDLRTRYYLQAADIDPATNRLTDVVIYDMSVPGRDRTVYADSGRMAFNREQTNLFLMLYDGRVHELRETDPLAFQRVFFKRQMLELEGVGNELERNTEDSYRSDREMGLTMLAAQVDSARKELQRIVDEAARQNATAVKQVLDSGPNAGVTDGAVRRAALEMRVLESRAESERQRMNRYQVEWHKKFAIPFACIVFVILGAPLAVRFPRGGVGMVIAVSLLIFGIYYISLIVGESLGDRGKVSPFWGPWAPNLLFLLFSLWGMLRIGRETSTARGGGWIDWWLAFREFLGRPRRRRA
ncbi:MAG: LptF/LptG family permease [Longimicrobiales bacterium]